MLSAFLGILDHAAVGTIHADALSDEDKDLVARCNKTTADTYATLIDRGVITGAEARLALANDPDSGFANIDADADIEPPDLALPMEQEENEQPASV